MNLYDLFWSEEKTEERTEEEASFISQIDEDYLRILLEQNLIGLEHEVPIHHNEGLI